MVSKMADTFLESVVPICDVVHDAELTRATQSALKELKEFVLSGLKGVCILGTKTHLNEVQSPFVMSQKDNSSEGSVIHIDPRSSL